MRAISGARTEIRSDLSSLDRTWCVYSLGTSHNKSAMFKRSGSQSILYTSDWGKCPSTKSLILVHTLGMDIEDHKYDNQLYKPPLHVS